MCWADSAFCSKVHLELQFLFLRGRGRRWGTHRIAAASAASTPELSYLTYIFGFLPWLPSPRPLALQLCGLLADVGPVVSLSLEAIKLIFSLAGFISFFFLRPQPLCFLLFLHCFSCCPCPLVLFPAFKSGLSFNSFLGRCRQIFVSFWPVYFFFFLLNT